MELDPGRFCKLSGKSAPNMGVLLLIWLLKLHVERNCVSGVGVFIYGFPIRHKIH